ncbi:MAG: FMN-binding protein [Dermatophilaceae bacterium]
MRRIVTAFLSTITALVLLFSYHTSTDNGAVAASPVVQQPGSASSALPGGATNKSKSSRRSPTPTPTPAPRPRPATAYTGGVADTQWGPVQVRITVRGHKITRAQAVQYPQGTSIDAQINSFALPVLDQEVVQQQRAGIDTVSGATVTSDGYLQSLQSAIDMAHL